MKEIEQYKAFIESVCNIYGIVDAIQPLQKALDDIAAQGVDTSTLPQDNSAYIAAFGTSIESDEDEQPWMCEACDLLESKTDRDQAKYDLKQYWHDADNVGDIKSMNRSISKYDWDQNGVKGMGMSGKFGNAYNLKNDGFGSLDSRNSGLAPVGRSQMKAQEKEFYRNDVNDQLGDMMATDPTGDIVNELKTALSDLYAKWNAQNDEAGVMASDADFRQYVEEALNDMTFQG